MAGQLRLTRRGRAFVFVVGALFSSSLLTYGVSELAGAAVGVNEVYNIPVSGPTAGTFTILGRGYGHGHGLSQYGAKGAADRGLNTSQILSFYYPGTTPTPTGGNIRVLLGIAGDPIQVFPTTSLTAVDTASGASTVLPTSIDGQPVKQWSMGTTPAGGTELYYLQSNWRAYKPLVGDGEFVDRALGYVTLAAPTTRQYAGAILAASPVRGTRQRAVVNIVSLEDYVASVTPSEMPSSWPPQALGAQAVAARTYAVFERAAHTGAYYDICDSTWCQVYGGRGAQTAATNQATVSTADTYLAYQQGQPAFTQFSASNGGWEADGGKPYLPSKVDPYTPTPEQLYGRSYSWNPTVSAAALTRNYPSIGTLKAITITSREGGAGAVWGGRVSTMTLNGSAGSVSISGDRFSAIYGLDSTWFTLQVAPQTYPVGPNVASGAAGLGQPVGPEVSVSAFGVTGFYQNFPGGLGVISSPYGTFVSNGAIYASWNPMANGWPTGNMRAANGAGISGYQQDFVAGTPGRAFWNSQYPSTSWVYGSILTKYDQVGGTPNQGWPSAEMTSQVVSGVQGWVQNFQGGRALISSSYGTFPSNGSIYGAWSPTANGWPTAEMTSQVVSGVQGWVQNFQGGRALISSVYGTYASNGSIYGAWSSTATGWPTANMSELNSSGITGYQQNFTGGTGKNSRAFWSSTYPTTSWVNGTILARYIQLGGTDGAGWPTAPATLQTVFGAQGSVQNLQRGRAIIASPAGTFISNGSIYETWNTAQFGWPTTDLTSTVYQGKSGWIQQFTKGARGPAYVFALAPVGTTTWADGTPQ